MMVPFTGLGRYNGFRGNRWLKNRIKVFKQFVVPSLLNQTNKNFIVWVAWRWEEKRNSQVVELEKFLKALGLDVVFTYSGCPFYDDKYPDTIARGRVLTSLHGAIGELLDKIGETDYVLMTIQPSDDCYNLRFVEDAQKILSNDKYNAFGYTRGFIMNYQTLELREYNPTTNPPFYTIKFPRNDFIDPLKHATYTSMKRDNGKYKAGTILPSHEYVVDVFGDGYITSNERGFLVGCHGENISTHYNIPFAGDMADNDNLSKFGLGLVKKLKINYSLRKMILRRLPHKVQRKLRYWFSEKLYEFFRN